MSDDQYPPTRRLPAQNAPHGQNPHAKRAAQSAAGDAPTAPLRPGHPDGRHPDRVELDRLKKKRRRRRTVGWIAFGVAALLVIAGGYGLYNYFHFASGVSKVDAIPGNGGKDADGKAQNILLVGNDQRPAHMTKEQYKELNTTPDGGSLNTDTMMILHVPSNGKSATLLSFPRDSWVDIPGYGMNKLNAAYAFGYQKGGDAGGAKLLITTMQKLTGLTIDHYVKVSLIGFYDIVQALGPIDVCLKEATSDPDGSGANFKAGQQTLDATQALAFVRQRHNLPRGDVDRTVRQQYFLSVEAQKLLSAGTLLNPVKLNNALGAISHSLETDSGLNLLSLAAQLRGLSGGSIKSATIPVTFGTSDSGLSIDIIDTAGMKSLIKRMIGTDATGKGSASGAALGAGASTDLDLVSAVTPRGAVAPHEAASPSPTSTDPESNYNSASCIY